MAFVPPHPPPLSHQCQASMVVKGQGWEREEYNSQASPDKGPKKTAGGNCSQWCPQPGKGRKLRLWIRLEEHLLEEEKVPVETRGGSRARAETFLEHVVYPFCLLRQALCRYWSRANNKTYTAPELYLSLEMKGWGELRINQTNA